MYLDPTPDDTTLDPDVEWALQYLLGHIPKDQWQERKSAIDTYFTVLHTPRRDYDPSIPLSSISYRADKIGWYLWLADAYLHRKGEYDFFQGARVIPSLKALGQNRAWIEKILGMEERITKMVNTETDEPDSALFELLTAFMYVRNGATLVRFVPTASKKTPDLEVTIFGQPLFVECKRLGPSQYSEDERTKWLKLWSPLAEVIRRHRLELVLEFTFHRELHELSDSFLVDQIAQALPKTTADTNLANTSEWTAKARPLDKKRIQAHLDKNYVKYPSPSFNTLISGEYRRHGKFTCMAEVSTVTIRGTKVLNQYIDDLTFATGVFWKCDSPRSVERKAKDIRGHLSEAFSQIPDDCLGIVHVGLESLDGWDVEQTRMERIMRTVAEFDARGKQVGWVYVHMFDFESPPDEDWAVDETNMIFKGHRVEPNVRHLSDLNIVIPRESKGRLGVPWDKVGHSNTK